MPDNRLLVANACEQKSRRRTARTIQAEKKILDLISTPVFKG